MASESAPTGDELADRPEVRVRFVTMLVFVGYGEEAGWISFLAAVLLPGTACSSPG